MTSPNVNPEELAKFNQIASEWWDTTGPFKPLHLLNPCRLDFIKTHTNLAEKTLLDVGCGGGILTESLARAGAQVTGIDMAEDVLAIAKNHAQHAQLPITYQCIAVEALAAQQPHHYDVITCMELLEHVPHPDALIQACAQLLKPGGHLFISTLNRTPKAFLLGIVGAEYLLNIVPRGTHHYSQFLRPSELNTLATQAHLTLKHLIGMQYNPLTEHVTLSPDVSINYLAHFMSE